MGKALAKEMGFCFIDIEDLYFPKTDPNYAYASPRTRREVEQLLFSEIKAQKDFVLASVKGLWREYLPIFPICRAYRCSEGYSAEAS